MSTLAGVELGNEIDGAAGINAKLPPAGYANDFATLKGLLSEVFGASPPPTTDLPPLAHHACY